MAIPQHVIQSVQLLVQTTQREKALQLERERFEFEKKQSAMLMQLRFDQLTAERKTAEAEAQTKELELQQKQMRAAITEEQVETSVWERAERQAMLGLPPNTPFSGVSSLDDLWRRYDEVRKPLSGDTFLTPDMALRVEQESSQLLGVIQDRTNRTKEELLKLDAGNPAVAKAIERLGRHQMEADKATQPAARLPASEEVYGAAPKGAKIGPSDKTAAALPTPDNLLQAFQAFSAAKSPEEQQKIRSMWVQDFNEVKTKFGRERARSVLMDTMRMANQLDVPSGDVGAFHDMMADAYYNP
jgi:hypothetical protein